MNNSQLKVANYELGVLLVPSLEAAYRVSRWAGFTCTPTAAAAAAAGDAPGNPGPAPAAAAPPPSVRFVRWQQGSSQQAAMVGGQLQVPLPIPYSLPPQRYTEGDRAWTWDGDWPGEDSWGKQKQEGNLDLYGWNDDENWGYHERNL